MQSHLLKSKTKRKTSRQVGRGGTRGKTAGRGTKGQNARAGRKKRPELRDFIKRFPKLRGRGISPFKSFAVKPCVVNLSGLDKVFKDGETVTVANLIERKAIKFKKGTKPTVKILGTGELTKKLTFQGIIVSERAKSKIEKAGGEIK
ncbi:MAG: 50S ribosomal protein L15 [Parcubacteria group bacterium]